MNNCIGAIVASAASLILVSPAAAQQAPTSDRPVAIRVATFNIEDLRTEELKGAPSERVMAAAEIVQRLRPNVLLVNEITYDQFGDPGFLRSEEPGQNGRRLAEILASPVKEGLAGIRYRAVMLPTNTGVASGFDLDRNGLAVTSVTPQLNIGSSGNRPPSTPSARAYGNDAWGYGEFPGQYGMAILIDERLGIVESQIRSFQLFPWSAMPGAVLPIQPNEFDEDGNQRMWYEGDAGELFRLSSKSHWDVPVRMPNGAVVHFLASHPTPPAFDGDELRNQKRNHDEIRFWADYVDNAAYIIDDNEQRGGLAPGSHFVILGDLNADPDEGSAFNNPIGNLLFASRWINGDFVPTSPTVIGDLDPDDTAEWGLRADYVLPSRSVGIGNGGVWREAPEGVEFPSDHYAVWIEISVPPPAGN